MNGIRSDRARRRTIFADLLHTGSHIFMLQETHSCPNVERPWEDEWRELGGGSIFWSHGTTNSRGVAVCLRGGFEPSIVDEVSDTEGRLVAVIVEIEKQIFTLTCIYGPNKPEDRPHFFHETVPLKIGAAQNVILGGDFNLCENNEVDRRSARDVNSRDHTTGQPQLSQLLDTYALVDAWREQNPSPAFDYTYKRVFNNAAVLSRLDRIYVPQDAPIGLATHFESLSDHKMVRVKIQYNPSDSYGKGVWRFPDTLVDDVELVQIVTDFWTGWKGEKNTLPTLAQWWDLGKLMAAELIKNYQKRVSKQSNRRLHALKQKIKYHTQLPNPDWENIAQWTAEVKEIKEKTLLTKIRAADLEQFQNDEKPTAYFFHSIKKHRARTTVDTVIVTDALGNEQIVSDPREVLKELCSFYQNLYQKSNVELAIQEELLAHSTRRVSERANLILNANITIDELFCALCKMANGKSPGDDGFTKAFYIKFWPLLGEDYLSVLHEVQETGALPTTQCNALITLLYKEGDRSNLANWRPISLLNLDYKMLTKVLANRLKGVLHEIIHPDQTCGIPGRTIHNNNVFTRDLLQYADENRLEAFLVSIDQEKAFDRVDHEFLFRTLRHFGFGETFVAWVKTIYTHITSKVKNKGFLSGVIHITRGVRQGCPLSQLLYVVVAEVLANAIRADDTIRGINLPSVPQKKLGGYADDLALYLATMTSVENAFKILNKYERATGAKVNPNKTKIFPLGPAVHRLQASLYPGEFIPRSLQNCKWIIPSAEDPHPIIKLLGILYCHDFTKTCEANYTKLLQKIDSAIQATGARHLSIRGRTIAANTTITAKLWYVAAIIYFSKAFISAVNQKLFLFVWGRYHNHSVKRTVLYQPIIDGGLALLDVAAQSKALLTRHIKAVTHKGDGPVPEHACLAFYNLCRQMSAVDPKWRALETGFRVGLLRGQVAQHPYKQSPFNITSDKIPIQYQITLNALYIHKQVFAARYPPTNKALYLAIKSEDERLDPASTTPFCHEAWRDLIRAGRNGRNRDKAVDWGKTWGQFFNKKTLTPNMLQQTAWRIIHRCLPTNAKMARRGQQAKPCPLCKAPTEHIVHVFCECPVTRVIWDAIYPKVRALRGQAGSIGRLNIYINGNHTPRAKQLLASLIVQTAQHYIWNFRCEVQFEGRLNDPQGVIKEIKTSLKAHIHKKHSSIKTEDDRKAFNDAYTIGGVLCQNQDGVLNTNI